MFCPTANHIYDDEGRRQTLEDLLNGQHSKRWTVSLSNEWGRLAQGNGRVDGTNTIVFIAKEDVPFGRDITYATFVCDYRPLKSEPWRIRMVAGGDRLSYPDDPASPAANLIDTKLLLNSVISDADKGARFISADLKNHFLASPMERPEYMRVPLKHIPQDIIERYNLLPLVHKGHVYIKIQKGMYGLKQAALLAYKKLVTHLRPFGYAPVPCSLSLWHHVSRPTKFALCVDDFGIKYFCKADADHLLNSLRRSFEITVDWDGKNYCGLNIEWNYPAGHVTISMPKYVPSMLKRLNHLPPKKPQFAPHPWTKINYGQRQQFAKEEDTSELLSKTETKRIQKIVGSALYYARALESPILPALTELAMKQSAPTTTTNSNALMLLDYLATHDNTKIRFNKSGMVLHCESDAAYLVAPGAKSRIAGHYFLADTPPKPPAIPSPRRNGAVHVLCKLLRHVVASAAEAETCALFFNAQMVIHMRRLLEALGHKQPPTPIQTDNSTAHDFVNRRMRTKKSKSWDMRLNWLKDSKQEEQFRVFWEKGSRNGGDYFTKHHSPSHHKVTRPLYIHTANNIHHYTSNSTPSNFYPSSSFTNFLRTTIYNTLNAFPI